MPLILEDGTGVANANTYVGVADVRDYATDRGIVLPVSDDDVVVAMIRATDYLQSLRYVGHPMFPGVQKLSWPRIDWWAYWSTSGLPQQIKDAQCELVIAQFQGIALLASQGGRGVGWLPTGVTAVDSRVTIREKVDVIDVQYSDALAQQTSSTPVIPTVDALLEDLVVNSFGFITGVRV